MHACKVSLHGLREYASDDDGQPPVEPPAVSVVLCILVVVTRWTQKRQCLERDRSSDVAATGGTQQCLPRDPTIGKRRRSGADTGNDAPCKQHKMYGVRR